MMDAIIYNKKLITNCEEIVMLPYYNENRIHFFNNINQISIDFVRDHREIDYGYKNDFSNVTFLNFIDSLWGNVWIEIEQSMLQKVLLY